MTVVSQHRLVALREPAWGWTVAQRHPACWQRLQLPARDPRRPRGHRGGQEPAPPARTASRPTQSASWSNALSTAAKSGMWIGRSAMRPPPSGEKYPSEAGGAETSVRGGPSSATGLATSATAAPGRDSRGWTITYRSHRGARSPDGVAAVRARYVGRSVGDNFHHHRRRKLIEVLTGHRDRHLNLSRRLVVGDCRRPRGRRAAVEVTDVALAATTPGAAAISTESAALAMAFPWFALIAPCRGSETTTAVGWIVTSAGMRSSLPCSARYRRLLLPCRDVRAPCPADARPTLPPNGRRDERRR